MTAQDEPVKQPWQPGLLRATAFYAGRLDVRSVDWWEHLTGQPPEVKNVRAGMGRLSEEGKIDSNLLRLQIQPMRIDWLLHPAEEAEGASFPLLGDFDTCAAAFRTLVSKWFPQAPPLTRLAFGAQLFIPTADREHALKMIAEMLPHVKINWEGTQDFVFQINRPRPCLTLAGRQLNRLVKWQTVVRRKILASFSEGQASAETTAEESAAYYELDLSTDAPSDDKTTLPAEHLEALLNEMVSTAGELVTRGESL